ncbi:MAG TPA: preprotein translocase subunit YajC [Steroidobacteraceae bacterium]|nr:preprotein translocase subunit YajC [Steroidobacteraceae bacterium]
MDFFIETANAQAAGGGSSGGGLQMIVFMGLFFVVFYFLLIRPQNKRAKEHKAMLAALAVGNEVVTTGGILGKVTEVNENFVSIEIASGVVIKVQRSQVSGLMPSGTIKSA